MNSTDVVGYTFNAATWCEDCLPVNSESEEVGAIFASSEWNFDVHCSACHELLLWKYKECAICGQPIWEHQDYRSESTVCIQGVCMNTYTHDSCTTEQLEAYTLAYNESASIEDRLQAISNLLEMKNMGLMERGQLDILYSTLDVE